MRLRLACIALRRGKAGTSAPGGRRAYALVRRARSSRLSAGERRAERLCGIVGLRGRRARGRRGAGSPGSPLPQAPGCPVFPRDNPWNQRVDRLPVARDSAALIRSIGADTGLHPDFGSGHVGGRADRDPDHGRRPGAAEGARLVRVRGRERQGPVSDPGERGDRGRQRPSRADRRPRHLHALRALCARADRAGGWHAGSGAIWSLRSNRLRPAGWTSRRRRRPADPARASRATTRSPAGASTTRSASRPSARGAPTSTRRATTRATRPTRACRRWACACGCGRATRSRGFPPQARVVLEALKRYGMILADNGSSLYVTGAPDPRWDNDDLHTLGRVTGADFEVVDTSGLRPLNRAGVFRGAICSRVEPSAPLDHPRRRGGAPARSRRSPCAALDRRRRASCRRDRRRPGAHRAGVRGRRGLPGAVARGGAQRAPAGVSVLAGARVRRRLRQRQFVALLAVRRASRRRRALTARSSRTTASST